MITISAVDWVGRGILTYTVLLLVYHELRKVYLCFGLIRSPFYCLKLGGVGSRVLEHLA